MREPDTVRDAVQPADHGSAFAVGLGGGDWHDPTVEPAARAEALLAEMTLDEKIGQMTQLEQGSVDPQGVGATCCSARC